MRSKQPESVVVSLRMPVWLRDALEGYVRVYDGKSYGRVTLSSVAVHMLKKAVAPDSTPDRIDTDEP